MQTPYSENNDAPWTEGHFVAVPADPGVSSQDLFDYLGYVPASQGWEMTIIPPDEVSGHDMGTWSFLDRSHGNALVDVNLVEPPATEPEGAWMYVTFTVADG